MHSMKSKPDRAIARTAWFKARASHAQNRKRFWLAQAPPPGQKCLFLAGDSILTGESLNAGSTSDPFVSPEQIINQMLLCLGSEWHAILTDGCEFEPLDAVLDILGKPARDIVVLQDSGPRPSSKAAFAALWQARILHVLSRGLQTVMVTSATAPDAPSRLNWNTLLPDSNGTANDILRSLASEHDVKLFDFAALADAASGSSGWTDMFLSDGIHLTFEGTVLFCAGLVKCTSGDAPDDGCIQAILLSPKDNSRSPPSHSPADIAAVSGSISTMLRQL
jgi:hypothetical protein